MPLTEICLQDSAPAQRRTAPSIPLDEERAVVERIQAGDRAAFATLYGWYGDAVYRSILARNPNRESAEDCLRDTFRTALEKIDSFTYDSRSIFFWIRRIGVNKAMDAHRRRQRDQALTERIQQQPDVPVTGQAGPAPDRGLDIADTARDVGISLSRMNPRYADVLRMRLLEDEPREVCAERLGVTLGNFDVLLHRATKAFRKVYPP